MAQKRILIIDGNYFCQRVLGQVNMGDSVNNLETAEEQKNFKIALNNSLVNLWMTFNNERYQLIDNIIFVTDFGSWRKDVEPFRPYYIPEDSNIPIGYKEQRKTKKEESPINYDNFYTLITEFVESIKDLVIVFKINKLEGDDNIMLLANKFANDPSIFAIIFGNDGDLNQVIKDNVIIFRNIKSKNAPNGEFAINLKTYERLFENSLLSNNLETEYYRTLFSIQIGCTNGTSVIKRDLHNGIILATPFRTALVKSISGDKKDNIFSLISWNSTTGTRRYSITENHISKALKKHGYSLTEDTCQRILLSKNNLINLLLSLKEVTKQPNVSSDSIIAHLFHNLRINMLSVNNVPEVYRKEFDKIFEENRDRIYNGTLDINSFKNIYKQINHNKKSSDIDVLSESIPEI